MCARKVPSIAGFTGSKLKFDERKPTSARNPKTVTASLKSVIEAINSLWCEEFVEQVSFERG